MKTSIEGFNQEKLVQLNLNCFSSLLLDWLVFFAHSGRQEIIHTIGKDNYYWVNYDKVFSDLPSLPFHSKQKLNQEFERLCGEYSNDPSKYPLKKHIISSYKFGKKIGIALNEPVIEWLRSSKREDMKTLLGDEYSTDKQPTQKYKLNPNIQKLLDKLLTIEKYDGSKLFRDKRPLDEYNYSKGIKHFSDYVYSLYQGRFLTEYPNNEVFIRKNKDYLENYKTEIQKCKGSWNNITTLVLKAAENYKTWFDIDCLPENKDWLRKNLSAFMYDKMLGGSLFTACISGSAFMVREGSAEKVVNSIPKEVIQLFKPLYKDSWDGFAYWSKVKSIITWYRKYSQDLISEDPNCMYWLDCGIINFMKKYKDYLIQLTSNGTLYETHIGTNCRTWTSYLNYAKEEHDISIEFPKR